MLASSVVGERATEALLTFEDVAQFDTSSQAGELEAGTWVPVTRSTWLHGEIVANITVLLGLYVREHREFSLSTGDPGTRLARAPDVLRGPDVAVVASERKPKGTGVDGWLDGAPDLVVEVVGDAQSPAKLVSKVLEYLHAGARMVWVVDGLARRVIVYTPPNATAVVGPDDELTAGDVLPGFVCRVNELFPDEA